MGDAKYFVHMLFDSASLTFPFICVGLYTELPLQIVQIIASMPFLFMIFFSTTFSPGAGVEAVKELRYLFARFYFWCDLPGFKDLMEDCPADNLLITYSILSGCLGLFLFLVVFYLLKFKQGKALEKRDVKRAEMEATEAFVKLQGEVRNLRRGENETTHTNEPPHPPPPPLPQLFGSKLIASPSNKSGPGSNGFELVSSKGEEAI